MDKFYKIFGDSLYGVGIGVIANVAYSFAQSEASSMYSTILGLYLIFIGSFIKDYK